VLVTIMAPEISELPKPQAFEFEYLHTEILESVIMQNKSASTDLAMMEGTRGLLRNRCT